MGSTTLKERIAELEAENAALREQVQELPLLRDWLMLLVGRVQELEARLTKDRHNSGKPPSSDELARKSKSLQRRSSKKPGGHMGVLRPV